MMLLSSIRYLIEGKNSKLSDYLRYELIYTQPIIDKKPDKR